ncbi:DUF2185 domain-containing protein [Aquabacterium sp. OR-4]|uniref:DUF2185 domain-containing protein n=1 Tax=Aquabacterium sp. OR-4 TaxID=2978127 RepID=UPI0028C9BE40|nr:DUF2185 domain-containing protein [Aquabacterium sp. OR-4]MDT7838972.1 DUF2185 domain-containing protein [Aquabacterium sp. OR-4]
MTAPLEPTAAADRCLATDKIVADGQPVRFMYREAPMFAGDSGWRFLAGTETDAYMEDPGHQRVHALTRVMELDPTVAPLLDSPVGAAFQRPERGAPFEDAGDWTPDED